MLSKQLKNSNHIIFGQANLPFQDTKEVGGRINSSNVRFFNIYTVRPLENRTVAHFSYEIEYLWKVGVAFFAGPTHQHFWWIDKEG